MLTQQLDVSFEALQENLSNLSSYSLFSLEDISLVDSNHKNNRTNYHSYESVDVGKYLVLKLYSSITDIRIYF